MEYVWLRELVPELWKWQALDLKIFPLFLREFPAVSYSRRQEAR